VHDCPCCGQACDCDEDDLWNDAASATCTCPCETAEERDDCDNDCDEAPEHCLDCGTELDAGGFCRACSRGG
jgi:hypothetical protein